MISHEHRFTSTLLSNASARGAGCSRLAFGDRRYESRAMPPDGAANSEGYIHLVLVLKLFTAYPSVARQQLQQLT